MYHCHTRFYLMGRQRQLFENGSGGRTALDARGAGMRFDLNKLLDGAGFSDVVTDDVDLSQYSAGGERPLRDPVHITAQAKNRVGVVSLDCT